MSEEKMTKEELREDPILTALTRLRSWFEKQATFLTIALAVVVVAVLGYQIARRVESKSEQQAALILLDGESQYMNGSPGDALTKFTQAYEQHKRSPSGKTALLRSADMQLELGSYGEAQRLYKRFIDSNPKDGLLRASALRGLAGALDSAGQSEEAGKTFLQAADVTESPLRADDLVSAGNAFMDAGKLPEALKAFQKVIEAYPDSPRVRDAKEGLEMARARTS